MTRLTQGAKFLFASWLLSATLSAIPVAAQNFAFTTIAGGTQGALDGSGAAAQFYNPMGLTVDAAGNIYVADQANNRIRKITALGTNWIVTTIAGGASGSLDGVNTNAQFYSPTGVAADLSGNLYVADQYNDIIRKIVPSGTNWTVTTIAGTAGLSGFRDGSNGVARFANPAAIAVDGATNLFVADEVNNAIRKATLVGTNWIVTTLAGGTQGGKDGTNTAAQFYRPSGVAVDSSGRVFVADQFNNTIRMISPAGTNWVVTTIAGQSAAGSSDGTGTNAHFYSPVGVAVGVSNNLFVADLFNNSIRRIAPSGTNWVVSTIGGGSLGAGDGTGTNASFNFPYGVAADAYGDVFVGDSENNAVRLGISTNSLPATGAFQTLLTPAGAISAGAKWSLDGGSLYASGAILPGLAPGAHTISFSTVVGFTTPAPQSVQVTARQTNVSTGNYPTAIPNAGSLQVMISPPGSVAAGAQWRVDGGALQTNAAIAAGLSTGSHTVSFAALAGWNTPSNQTVYITNSQTTLTTATYILQTGSLQVTILPASAVTSGAKWQVDGGTFQTSGATLSGLLPGNHTVAFVNVLGWTAPSNQVVSISNALTTAFSATYTQQGSLQVTLQPAGAVTAGARWQVDGGSWQTNGAILSSVLAGAHTLAFNSISGWTTPSNQTVSVVAYQTASAVGSYVALSNYPPRLAAMKPAGGNFQFALFGPPGSNYVIQASSNLSTWTVLLTNAIPSNGSVVITDSNMAGRARRFYRALGIPVSPFVLSGFAMNHGTAQFVVHGRAQSVFVIQVSTNLTSWSPLFTNSIPGAGMMLIADPGAAGNNRRFYRAYSQQP